MAILVGLGGNLPFGTSSPVDSLKGALADLQKHGVSVVACSPFYRSAPVPPSGQPDFINAVAQVETSLSAAKLLSLLHQIEAAYGRKRQDRWQARTLDLDLLLYDDLIAPSSEAWWAIVKDADPAAFVEQVMCPHPRLHLRAFALRPLLDLLPDFIHPVFNQTGQSLYDQIADQSIDRLVLS